MQKFSKKSKIFKKIENFQKNPKIKNKIQKKKKTLNKIFSKTVPLLTRSWFYFVWRVAARNDSGICTISDFFRRTFWTTLKTTKRDETDPSARQKLTKEQNGTRLQFQLREDAKIEKITNIRKIIARPKNTKKALLKKSKHYRPS